MKFSMKRRTWRLIYAVCCLIYMAWVSYQGSFDFDRVWREYSRTVERLDPGRIHADALQQLAEECRKEIAMRPGDLSIAENGLQRGTVVAGTSADRDCSSWPPAVVEKRVAKIKEHREERRQRAARKLLLFAVFFVVLFLFLPPALVYCFAVLVGKLFQTVKIVRKE